jgi:mannosylglycoprotein endo-beta-mannosidase
MNLPAFNLLNDNSKETIQEYTESGTPTWDVTWEWHTYQPFSIPSTNTAQYPTVTDQLALYGIPGKPEAFCEQAQLAAYDQYRALVEGSNSRMWINCNGMLIWKSQNPWTGLRGSLYDWYLEQTGGFFGCLHAAEPVHVQFNLYSKQIEVVNSTGNDVSNVKLNAKVIGLDGKMTTIFDDTISVSKLTTKAFEIKEPLNEEGIYFLLLELSESEKAEQKEQKTPCIISRNFYWLSTEDGPKRFEELQEWRTTKTPVSITGTGKRVGSSFDIDLELVNETGGNTDVKANVAFWIRFQVFTPETVPERILPVFYEDNYISLAPMEKRYLHINLETDTIASTQEPIISISGWNVDSQTVNIIWD